MRMGMEPISQPMPPLQPSIVDTMSATNFTPTATSNGLSVSAAASDKLKTEYKPEQLATLLHAAASQPLTMTSLVQSSAPQNILATQSPITAATPLSTAVTGLLPTSVAASVAAPALPLMPGMNGTAAALYRQSLQQVNNTAFSPQVAAVSSHSPLVQNGKFCSLKSCKRLMIKIPISMQVVPRQIR